MDIYPYSEPLFFAERSISYLDRNSPVFFLAGIDESARIGPSPITVDYAKPTRQIGMGLNQQRFEQAAVRFNLALQLIIQLWAEPRLLFVRNDIIQVSTPPVSAKDRPIETALLQIDDVSGVWSLRFGRPLHCTGSLTMLSI
jgi:hypothetical protein